MKNSNIPSQELERSMDLQVHVMTIGEALRNVEVIDELDDRRREKLHNIINWNKEMQKSFIKDLEIIIKNCDSSICDIDIALKNMIKNLLEKQIKFTDQFNKSIDEVLKQELEYEKIDDNTRCYLINYTEDCREELKNKNSEIEARIILERMAKNG
ncbi:hypothetical protein F350042L8_07060 [Fusobacterium ulcerans]|uniref:hypothetical protein n=1 Tax=Fusobacterium ulcerans TaxID=861 RepID=UPI0034C50C45